ncbi:hypothetical protein ACWD3K_38410, partial [Streptomyces sp. NPDC002778]
GKLSGRQRGRHDGRQRGELLAAYGENEMAVDNLQQITDRAGGVKGTERAPGYVRRRPRGVRT